MKKMKKSQKLKHDTLLTMLIMFFERELIKTIFQEDTKQSSFTIK